MSKLREILKSRAGISDASLDPVSIAGFTALVRVSERISRTTEVPVVYLEDGSPIQDHIIKNPVILTIEGDVSNVFVQGDPLLERVENVNKTISVIDQYLPARTQTQLTKINAIANDINDAVNKIDQAIEDGGSVLNAIGARNDAVKNNQKEFLDAINSAIDNNQLLKINMPFKGYDSMVITSFDVEYDNEGDSTGFTIELTQIRFAEDIEEIIGIVINPSRDAENVVSSPKEKGLQNPKDTELSSFGSDLLGDFGTDSAKFIKDFFAKTGG